MSDDDDDLRRKLSEWFHREFGLNCMHPTNSRWQCAAWADQFLLTGAPLLAPHPVASPAGQDEGAAERLLGNPPIGRVGAAEGLLDEEA